MCAASVSQVLTKITLYVITFSQQGLIALSETWHLGVTLLTARIINFNQKGGEGMINY